ncbi:hypothetical protein A2U01_0035291, partial [Trifolium medium]|nr:hypothetical protein [Trifolium medium]
MINYEHENDTISAEEALDTTSISETGFKQEKDIDDITSISETDFQPDKDTSELKYLLLT